MNSNSISAPPHATAMMGTVAALATDADVKNLRSDLQGQAVAAAQARHHALAAPCAAAARA